MSKILFITNQTIGSGGLERVLSIRTHFLVEKCDYDLHIITLAQDEKSSFFAFNEKIHFHDISYNGNGLEKAFRYYNQLNAIINKVKPELITVCDDGIKAFTLPFLLRRTCPLIYERHVSKLVETKSDQLNWLQNISYKIKNYIMNHGARYFDKVVLLTQESLKEWPFIKNMIIISNPIPFEPQIESTLTNNIVIAVGRQHHQKGYDRLLKIWGAISKKYPEWQLHIYGKKDPNLKLEDRAQQMGISNSVKFFNPVKDIASKYANASIFVLPSRFEGFGMVLIEAMAFGLPAISFDCPFGPSDIITDEINGYLVENGNLEKFSSRLETLIHNKNLRYSLGQKAKTITEKYSLNITMHKWNELYQNLIKNA